MKKSTISVITGILWGFTALIQLYSLVADNPTISEVGNWCLAGSGLISVILISMYPNGSCRLNKDDRRVKAASVKHTEA